MANAIYNVEAIRAATVAARDGAAEPVPQTREQQIADLIESRFGCHKVQVRELVVLLGHELPAARGVAGGAPQLGTLAFYEGDTALITGFDGDGDALYVRLGSRGGSYIGKGDAWRYATDAELDAFAAA